MLHCKDAGAVLEAVRLMFRSTVDPGAPLPEARVRETPCAQALDPVMPNMKIVVGMHLREKNRGAEMLENKRGLFIGGSLDTA